MAKLLLALPLLALVLWISGLQSVFSSLAQFSLASLVIVVMLLGINLWLVGFRFWRVLDHFSIRVSLAQASRASLAGHVAGLMLISLLGQVAGRQSILRSFGVTPLLNASLAAYERVLLALVSGSLAIVSATYLLGGNAVEEFFQRVPLLEISALIAAGVILSLLLGGTTQEIRWISGMATRKTLLQVMSIFALTLAGQMLVLLSFVAAILTLHGDLPLVPVFAAAAVISFAASLPISVNGWGVRELASIFVLGKMGVPAADAAAISILIGLCSTAVIAASAPLMLWKRQAAAPAPVTCPGEFKGISSVELERAFSWFMGMAVALTIFFQFHVEMAAGILNLNMADPFALLALAAVGLGIMMTKQPARWRIEGFNRMLLAITIMLIAGFAHGWAKIGITQWALGGRLLGWIVLVGYISSGYILTMHAGNRGLRRLAETLAVFAVLVVLWQATSRMLVLSGWLGETGFTQNFEGYSGNRNAFAFQLLVVTALLLAYFPGCGESTRARMTSFRAIQAPLVLGILLAGIVWAGSRAGLLAGAIMLFACLCWKADKRKTILGGVGVACLLWIGQWAFPTLLIFMGVTDHGALLQSYISGESSNYERFSTWIHALELWRDSPLTGAGLGVFMARSSEWLGHPQVVHSTPLWLLAEFGLIGVAVLSWSALGLVRYAFGNGMRHGAPHRIALALLLICFLVFGLFHEIFYQRIFWFVLGALLARPGTAVQLEKSNG
jgi:uncharacterized membrane protein YbhN (UPF0104 family)